MTDAQAQSGNAARDWGCVNVRFLWKHRHVHPMIRERLRWWIDYARTA